jgi:hypothetical protein
MSASHPLTPKIQVLFALDWAVPKKHVLHCEKTRVLHGGFEREKK